MSMGKCFICKADGAKSAEGTDSCWEKMEPEAQAKQVASPSRRKLYRAGHLLPTAGPAKPQVAAPAQPTQANWLSCSNLILNPSPKSTEVEDQKYPVAWFSELVLWALYPKVLESCICTSLRPLQAEEVGA